MEHTSSHGAAAPTRKHRRWPAAAAAAVLVASGLTFAFTHAWADDTENSDSDPPVVQTDKGKIRGTHAGDVTRYQGVPYATAPVDDLSWRSPQEHEEWDNVKDATKPGSACPQLDGNQGGVPSTDEDCLYVNVTAPQGKDIENLPVVVFTHGGGNYGAGHQYNADKLAARGDAVVVTVNYRLGVYGFLAHQSLDDGSSHGSGNLGLEDQQAALKWVQRNASAFGGDDDNVTLMGESWGGWTACANLTSPQSKGLFDKVILQSAPCAGMETQTRDEAEAFGAEVVKNIGCDTDDVAQCLRDKPVAEVLDGFGQVPDSTLIAGDGLLPLEPSEAIESGHFNRVPVLHGINRDEQRLMIGGAESLGGKPITDDQYPAKLVESFGEELAPLVEKQYPLRDYDSASEALAAAQTDHEYAAPAVDTVETLSRHVPTHAFEFADPHAPWFRAYDAPSFPTGAYHMAELNYLFDVDLYHPKSKPQHRLGAYMIDTWASFAHTGAPDAHDPGTWPEYGHGQYVQSLAPGEDGIGSVDFAREHHYRFWNDATS